MPLPFWKIAVLAVIQGITEFLPISSDGHLLIAAALMSPDGTVKGMELHDLTIVLHMGTLLSILVFYWPRIWQLLSSDFRTAGLIIVGTLPAVVIGLPIELFGEALVENIVLGGAMLVLTGCLLIWASRQATGRRSYRELTVMETVRIGIGQALAILPGLSRSGTTISTAMAMKLEPKSAATFSFLLAIPALTGAGVLKLLLMILKDRPMVTPVPHLIAGTAISFLVGLGALWVLVRSLERGRFQWFAAWCIPLGFGVVVWQLLV